MASANALCKKLLAVKSSVVTGYNFYTDTDGVDHLTIYARSNRWHEDDCPICHKRCRKYDSQSTMSRRWRGLDWGSTLVESVGRFADIENTS